MIEFAGKKIDLSMLSSIQHRIMLVGRFNWSKTKPGKPDLYLFSDKDDLNEEYLKQFTNHGGLSYTQFSEKLMPRIAEIIKTEGRFPSVVQSLDKDGDDSNTAVVNELNYFYTRAISNSEQEAFKIGGSKDELLDTDEKDRGKEILRQIRSNLSTFCEFQPKNTELLACAAYALENCRGEGIPGSFVAGAEFPINFTECFIDFIYDERTDKSFEDYLEKINFNSGPWVTMHGDTPEAKKGKWAFVIVINALRDHFLEGEAKQYRAIDMHGDNVAAHIVSACKIGGVDSDIVESFNNSRKSFNSLRQIVGNKVLLSMVLEWLMTGFYELEEVRNEKLKARKIDAIEAAIATGKGVAPPVKRATKELRDSFSESLSRNFEDILKAIFGYGSDSDSVKESKEKSLQKLPSNLKDVVEQLRNDDSIKVLAQLCGFSFNPEDERNQGEAFFENLWKVGEESQPIKDKFNGFVDSVKTILMDVLLPVLYQSPLVDHKKLESCFRKDLVSVYLTSLLLSDENQEKFVSIAEDNVAAFTEALSDDQKSFKAVELDGEVDQDKGLLVQANLLKRVLKELADPTLANELREGMKVINNVQDILGMVNSDEDNGASSVVVARNSLEAGKVLDATQVGSVVDKALNHRIGVCIDAKVKVLKENKDASVEGSNDAIHTGKNALDSVEVESPEQGSVDDDNDGQTDVESSYEGSAKFDPVINNIIDKLSATNMENLENLSSLDIRNELKNNQKFEAELQSSKDDLVSYQKRLDLIYRRYNENEGKKVFRNKVERLTLINMMLLWRKNLGFGKVLSSLYMLLLDLILELDPENPQPMDFLKKFSLTKYFDNEHLTNRGFAELEAVLVNQCSKSLKNVVTFVSELRGVTLLMDKLSQNPKSELIVVNADADEFLKWFYADNLTAAQGDGRLRTSGVFGNGAMPIYPALVYMTDTCFGGSQDRKLSWLQGLRTINLKTGAFTALMPPICVSTGPQKGSEESWISEGNSLVAAAKGARAPVLIAGPSPRINPESDGFPTILPAGYLIASQIAGGEITGLRNNSIAQRSVGRFCTLGVDAEGFNSSIANCIFGTNNADYCFSADYYLYIISLLFLAMKNNQGDGNFDVDEFWYTFCFPKNSPDAKQNIFKKNNKCFDNIIFNRDTSHFALAQFLPATPLKNIYMDKGTSGSNISENRWENVTSFPKNDTDLYNWFNLVLDATSPITERVPDLVV